MKERSILHSVGRAGSPSPPCHAEHRRARRSRPTSPVALVLLLLVGAIARGQEPRNPSGLPKIDHILLEVADLKKSIGFYHDFLGLEIKSQSRNFAMLQSGNVGV